MSLLVIQLPARPRRVPQSGAEPPAAPQLPALWDYVLSADGLQLTRAGRASLATLPRARTVVAVMDDVDVAWHRLEVLPRAPAGRLRAALAGVLEERLLEDEDQLHFALAAGAVPGQPCWVAVAHKPALQSALAALESAGLEVDRVLASCRPVAPAQPWEGRFSLPQPDLVDAAGDASASAAHPEAPLRLTLAGEQGVVALSTAGALARALLPEADTPVRFSASPAAAAAAEAWLGAPVAVERDPERLLALARAALVPGAAADNLLQFDLAPRRRGSRALDSGLQQLASPRWRPVRWGLATLVAVQLIGLNVHAWQQGQALKDKRQAMAQLLRDTHPGVRAVLDPALQMQRETERLRTRAGRAGGADLESMLAAAAAAWPDGQGPVQTLRYEGGRLTLSTPGWSPQELTAFQQRLHGGGYLARSVDGTLVLSRAGASS
jgi:general secretion pathway protein L